MSIELDFVKQLTATKAVKEEAKAEAEDSL